MNGALLRMTVLVIIGWILWSMLGPTGLGPPTGTDPTRPLPRPELSLPLEGHIDRIVIEKKARRLSVYQQDKLVREYRIALGFAPDGDKVRQGDGKTPEGIFRVDRRNDRSQYYLSIGIDYPQPDDRKRARLGGYDPGGDIFIHGQPNQIEEGFRVKGDWTEGCIAIDNHQIDELFAATRIGTEVEIRP